MHRGMRRRPGLRRCVLASTRAPAAQTPPAIELFQAVLVVASPPRPASLAELPAQMHRSLDPDLSLIQTNLHDSHITIIRRSFLH